MHTRRGLRFGWISFPLTLAAAFCLAILLSPGQLGAQATTGAVEGRVYDVATGEPLEGLSVSMDVGLGDSGQQTRGGTGVSDAEGRYRIEGLEPGSYRFYIYRPGGGYIGQIYSRVPCPFPGASYGSSCDDLLSSFGGTSVSVVAGETLEGIDFPLDFGGQIIGQVTAADTGDPLRARVGLLPQFGDLTVGLASTFADADGRYSFQSLPGGTYEIVVFDVEGYLEEEVEQIGVTLGEVTTADIALQSNTTLSGRVLAEGSGEGVDGGRVLIFDALGGLVGETPIAADGSYEYGHLEDGSYYLWTNIGFQRPWIDQIYGGDPCAYYEPCDVTSGTPVAISGGTSVTDIDFFLTVGGSIAGTVLKGTQPVLEVLAAFTPTGDFIGETLSDPEAGGKYLFQGLGEGTHFLVARGLDEPPILYENLPCGPDSFNLTCDVTTGTPIPVVLGETTPEIDFTFVVSTPGACAANAANLCLNNGRFEVKMNWETPLSSFGQGAAVNLPFADDSGYFYFFSPDNVEVVVKVLDACHTSFDSFWVFAAGLTNLRVEMTVTDTVSGEVRTYTNPLQTPFEPILDTRAFRTCDAVVPGAVNPGAVNPGTAIPGATTSWSGLSFDDMSLEDPSSGDLSWLGSNGSIFDEPETQEILGSQPALGEEGCVSDGLAICLQGGRFKVEAEYRTAQGGTSGVSEFLTDDTGVFFFFSRDNAELVVKVLSNCNGRTNKFWVFAAGLTNVEVTLRVTDTLTGAVKTYVNPLGESFQPILDTQAFDTCDGT